MLSSLPNSILYTCSILVSAIISLYSVKKIIFVTRKRGIYDIPDNIRKIHGKEIPSLGGVGIFTGFMATAPFFVSSDLKGWNYLIISSVLLFFTGVYDDIMNMRPSKKLLVQLLASAITVYFADIRIVSLNGFMGIQELPYWLSVGSTVFFCTFFINVFNFIDGIDGLAGMMSILYTCILGILLATGGHTPEAYIAFCLMGATLGLLYFNYPPAKIYMGDTGSMLSGFSIFILAALYLKNLPATTSGLVTGNEGAIVVLATLSLPVFDALRVFFLRAINGISPLNADRRHLHYYLLDAGLTHARTAWLLIGVNLLTIALGWLLRDANLLLIAVGILAPSVITSVLAARFRKQQA